MFLSLPPLPLVSSLCSGNHFFILGTMFESARVKFNMQRAARFGFSHHFSLKNDWSLFFFLETGEPERNIFPELTSMSRFLVCLQHLKWLQNLCIPCLRCRSCLDKSHPHGTSGMDYKSCLYPIKANKPSRSVEMIALTVIRASTRRQRGVDIHLSHSQRSTTVKRD